MDINRTFENGVGLFTCENPGASSFCLELWVRRGSMHEPKEHHGLAHFLEHVVFRNIRGMMDGQLYHELNRLALSFDASTYCDHVTFEVSGPSCHFDEAVDILMMVLKPLNLSVEALDLERKRVKAEILEGDDENGMDACVFKEVWKDTPRARTISGTQASVNRIGFKALQDEHDRWFSAGNFFFCGAGNMPGLDKLAARIEALEPGNAVSPADGMAEKPADFFRRDARIITEQKDYTYLRFSFDADTSRYTEPECMILRDWLFGESGPFYMQLSEDAGLTYDVNSVFDRFANIGCFFFEYETDKKLMMSSIEKVIEILNDIPNVSDDTIETVCRSYVLNADFVKDDCVDYCYTWGYDNGFKQLGFRNHEERKTAHLAIKPERIRQMAREIFKPENLVLYIRGNERRIKKEEIRSILMKLHL